MIIEPTIKANFERGFASSNVKTFEDGTEFIKMAKEKEKYLQANSELKSENESLKLENETLKTEIEELKNQLSEVEVSGDKNPKNLVTENETLKTELDEAKDKKSKKGGE